MSQAPQDGIHEALSVYFGFPSFKPNQRDIVDAILAGHDVFAVMPTGGGKSLCYQLPSVLLPGLTLVISPLISLMKDQVDAARLSGLSAHYLNSTLTQEEARETYRRIREGTTKLLYVAPERLASDGFTALLSDIPVSLIAIDEAHCISEWGHEFRPDYRELARLRALYPEVGIAAFTATATLHVQKDVIELLGLRDPYLVRASFDRAELCYRVSQKATVNRQILDFIRVLPDHAGIVYRATRKSAESTAKFLNEAGVRAAPYHAGLPERIRRSNQEAFKNDEIDTIVATIAFGMGIDKSNIRYVIHGDLPRSIEGYYQETGRAGRDGESADCMLFYGPGDIAKVRYHIDRLSDPDERERANRNLVRMISFAQANVCRRVSLLGYFDETYTPPCGNCDVCRGELVTSDATEEAQKVLSAVVRTGQRFGRHYIADVVLGSSSDRIRQNGHHDLPTFGVGSDRPKQFWLHVADELIAQGFLNTSQDRYAVLALSGRGRELLKGELDFRITEIQAGRKEESASLPFAPDLFDRLRSIRREAARAIGRPPYMVFSDKTLREMATKMPRNKVEMLAITGVGAAKFKSFGYQFLSAIAAYRETEGS